MTRVLCHPFALLMLLAEIIAACGSTEPAPRHSSQDFLQRRKMSALVIEVAKAAETAGDIEKEVQSYAILVELWPDLPEAAEGGAWHRAFEDRKRLMAYGNKVERAQNKGRALEDRLSSSQNRLSTLGVQLEKAVAPKPFTSPEPGSRALQDALTTALDAATLGVLRGALP